MKELLHPNGWNATKEDLESVPVPSETASYAPVPYTRFIEELEVHVPRFGLSIDSAAYSLGRDGQQMFGLLTLSAKGPERDYAIALGVRNSYDRSVGLGLVAGTRVFVCENLGFSGECIMTRKHTANVFRDLPNMTYRMLSKVSGFQEQHDREIASWKERVLGPSDASHLLIAAVKVEAIPVTRLPHVIDAWENPEHAAFTPRTAWSLYNAITKVQKSRSPRDQMEGCLRLTDVFREVLSN